MNSAVAERVAALEVERTQPTPRRPKSTLADTDTPEAQRRRREDLLADLRKTT